MPGRITTFCNNPWYAVRWTAKKARGRLEVQGLRLRPDKVRRGANVSGIAVEQSDPEHRVPGLHMPDLTANLFHPA